MTAPVSELPALDTLDDTGLGALVRRAGDLLKEREHARQRDAIEQARAVLAGAGPSVQGMLEATGRGAAAGKGMR